MHEEKLHAEVRGKALAVMEGALTPEQFLRWIHDEVGHAGPDEYQDLVEMDCVPPLRDAGAGQWFANSPEALPLREWVRASISRLARGLPPEPLPPDWTNAII